MKIKKTSNEIKDRILDELNNGPKTVADISSNINSNWLTTEKFLNELKNDNLVIEVVSTPKMKIYRRIDELAYYGIPFSQEIRKKTLSLLCTVAKKWKSNNPDINTSKTILQKITVELIESSNGKINLPVLKFHYGKTTALRYDEDFEQDCEIYPLSASEDEKLTELVKKYKKMSTSAVKKEQYQKEDMKFYKIKEEEIIDNFLSNDFKKLENGFLLLSAYYPTELENVFQLFDDFIYCSIIVLNLEKEEKEEYIKKIKEVFYILWDTITTTYFFLDAEKWILDDKKELFDQIKNNILISKTFNLAPIIEDLKSDINSINPGKISKADTKKSKDLLHELLEE